MKSPNSFSRVLLSHPGPAVGAWGDPEGTMHTTLEGAGGAIGISLHAGNLTLETGPKSRLYGTGKTHHPNFVPMDKRTQVHPAHFIRSSSPGAARVGEGERGLI